MELRSSELGINGLYGQLEVLLNQQSCEKLLVRLLDGWFSTGPCRVSAEGSNVAQVERFKSSEWWVVRTLTRQCPSISAAQISL